MRSHWFCWTVEISQTHVTDPFIIGTIEINTGFSLPAHYFSQKGWHQSLNVCQQTHTHTCRTIQVQSFIHVDLVCKCMTQSNSSKEHLNADDKVLVTSSNCSLPHREVNRVDLRNGSTLLQYGQKHSWSVQRYNIEKTVMYFMPINMNKLVQSSSVIIFMQTTPAGSWVKEGSLKVLMQI